MGTVYDATAPAEQYVLGPGDLKPYSHAYLEESPIAQCGAPLVTTRQSGLRECPACLAMIDRRGWVAR